MLMPRSRSLCEKYSKPTVNKALWCCADMLKIMMRHLLNWSNGLECNKAQIRPWSTFELKPLRNIIFQVHSTISMLKLSNSLWMMFRMERLNQLEKRPMDKRSNIINKSRHQKLKKQQKWKKQQNLKKMAQTKRPKLMMFRIQRINNPIFDSFYCFQNIYNL